MGACWAWVNTELRSGSRTGAEVTGTAWGLGSDYGSLGDFALISRACRPELNSSFNKSITMR